MSLRRIAATVFAVAALGTGLLVPSSSVAQGQCQRGETAAKFTQPEGGQLSANTHLGGIAYTLPGSTTPLAVMLSTTGEVEVEIQHRCVQALRLIVYKDGEQAPIHTNAWANLSCDEGVINDIVEIGLDGGSYRFELEGVGCDGSKLRSDGQGGLIVDPPLGL
ncbi:MAG TPA: hypothetical protein VM841_14615 [Actinomycetota bacterium]|nr:hypothetical protein [Actinomycetota bacterium]